MNRRPGHVVVTTEVAMCSFCGRPRTLRIEEHALGALVRTIVTCETCHRTLSSSIAVANAEPAAAETIAAESESAPAAAPPTDTLEEPAAKPTAQPKPKPKPAATKATAAKSRTHKKTR